MKTNHFILATILGISASSAQSLYYTGDEAQESLPLRWTVGANVIYDNNLVPIVQPKQEAWSINPYVQASMTNINPQTTIDVYARVGVIYFLTDSDTAGADETFPQARLGFDLFHNFDRRLRFTSRNAFAYEFEPDYAQGFSSPRGLDPYILWSSDNAVGYRWTPRLGSYTGFTLGGLVMDNEFGSRSNVDFYHNFRYQLSRRSTLTAGYRYGMWTGDQLDSTNQFLTGGIDYRLDRYSVLSLNAGIQLREVDGADSTTSPFFEAAINTRITKKFNINAFARYSTEDFDTIQPVGSSLYQYADQQVFRIGINANYALAPRLNMFGGVDLVNTAFDGAILRSGSAVGDADGRAEDLLNFTWGLTAAINQQLSAQCAVTYTTSESDFNGNDFTRDFDRMRISAGLNYTF